MGVCSDQPLAKGKGWSQTSSAAHLCSLGVHREGNLKEARGNPIQQAITQVLSPIFEQQFSDSSIGFRPRRSAHDALCHSQQHINAGHKYVVDMDLEKYFDTVNQSKLIQILSETVKDGRVISLIHKFLRAGIMVEGLFEESPEGVPQGGPLSPLLGNIMLNECDHELEKRGHRFVRYADDMIIFCKSRKAADRTLRHILPYIEGRLFLRVNREKTSVAHVGQVKLFCKVCVNFGTVVYRTVRTVVWEVGHSTNGWTPTRFGYFMISSGYVCTTWVYQPKKRIFTDSCSI